MCGRFTLLPSDDDLAEFFGLAAVPALTPRYNIAPTQDVAVVRVPPGEGAGSCGASREFQGVLAGPRRPCRHVQNPEISPIFREPERTGRNDDCSPRSSPEFPRHTTRHLVLLRWGLVPHWAKDKSIGNRLINARSETVDSKPAFRAAFRNKRCLLPASGFFEWKKEPHGRQPYYVLREDEGLLAFAGLWERWMSTDGEVVESCTILTTEASEDLRDLHHRMPVILDRSDFEAWLDPGASRDRHLKPLLRPCASGPLVVRRVSKVVNSPRNDVPECVEPESE